MIVIEIHFPPFQLLSCGYIEAIWANHKHFVCTMIVMTGKDVWELLQMIVSYYCLAPQTMTSSDFVMRSYIWFAV